jgi:7,8-didemethyl-8-hydroxy-5-deazariboflavin synthase CofG subunit
LLTEEGLEEILAAGRTQGAKEALLISGEHPGTMPHIRAELRARGFEDFTAFAIYVAGRVLEAGLLPHGNYGALSETQLRRLRPWHVSMGVMLENVEDDPALAPEKKAAGRLATIEAAGRLRIPFTSGILIGLGETEASRFRSLEALAVLHERYGHLQEILIQNFVPNPGSNPRLGLLPVPGVEEVARLARYWRERCPDVPVQIPPNLNLQWRQLLDVANDLGGISTRRDEVNPTRPWAPEAVYSQACAEAGVRLRERLAVYDRFIGPEWIDAALLSRVKAMRRALDSAAGATAVHAETEKC